MRHIYGSRLRRRQRAQRLPNALSADYSPERSLANIVHQAIKWFFYAAPPERRLRLPVANLFAGRRARRMNSIH